jgi:diguanylate cyclase (GGDEF)-like protein/PAS domain S-box-containing protein
MAWFMISVENWTQWRHGLVARSLFVVFMVVMLVAGVSGVFVSSTIDVRESQQAMKNLNELVETVANTSSIASFTQDEQLAAEVVDGIMSNSDVLRVTIYSTEGVLASAARDNVQEISLISGNSNQIVYPLISPFLADDIVGEIVLEPDTANITARIQKITSASLTIQIGQMALVIAITAAVMFFLVVRPIKAISDRLHNIADTSATYLKVPLGHNKSEIGQLVGDINALTGRLVSTLEHERDLQKQQLIARRKYQNLFDHVASGIFVANSTGELESFNRAFASLTWLPETLSTRVRSLTDIGWHNSSELLAMLANSLEASETQEYQGDFALSGRRGDERWLHVAILPLGDGNVQGTISDITQRKQEEISAKHQAITDTVTGFSNRGGLQNALSELSADFAPFALVMVDLNGFKQINEALGFHIGDQLLFKVATRLKQILRPNDHAARIDADEFVLVLFGEQERSSLNNRMDYLVELLSSPYEIVATDKPTKTQAISINASIGIGFFPADGSNLNDLLRSAELALNSPDERADTNYHYSDPAQKVAVEHRRRLEDDLRQAINTKELELYFQPIVDITANKMMGAEALLRWHHPEEGMIPPDVFIPLAEQVGLINQIGVLVVQEACRYAAEWRAAGNDIYVSVNVSAKQIPNGLSPSFLQQALKLYELPPSAIVIEITEGLLMANVAVAQTWIENIRALGIRIYLDDFGTGYSSLSYLKRFPMDTVKIDRSFIRDLYIDNSDRALVEAIITMARSLGLQVVAEGVEDECQLELLREMGCEFVQGYYFSRPVKGTELMPTMMRINNTSSAAESITIS